MGAEKAGKLTFLYRSLIIYRLPMTKPAATATVISIAGWLVSRPDRHHTFVVIAMPSYWMCLLTLTAVKLKLGESSD